MTEAVETIIAGNRETRHSGWDTIGDMVIYRLRTGLACEIAHTPPPLYI